MWTKSRTVFACFLCVFLFQDSFAQQTEPSGLANSIIRDAAEKNAISFRFDNQLSDAAVHYARKTRFAGNVRVNKSYKLSALNIYSIDASKGSKWSSLFRGSCRSWAIYNLIICDVRFLDAMPLGVLRLSSSGPEAAPPLMYWAIGHEIGHVVLNHSTGRFGQSYWSSDEETSQSLDGTTPQNKFQREIDADEFAVNGLPIKSPEDLNVFHMSFINAFFHELDRWGSSPDSESPLVLPPPDPYASHPVFIWRLNAFIAFLKDRFTLLWDMRGVEIRVGEDSNLRVEDDLIFHDGLYVDQGVVFKTQTEKKLDFLTSALVEGSLPLHSVHISLGCHSDVEEASRTLLTSHRNVLCNQQSVTDNPVVRCMNYDASNLARCAALQSLQIWFCDVASSKNWAAPDACAHYNEMLANWGASHNAPINLLVRDNSLLSWMPGLKYLIITGDSDVEIDAIEIINWATSVASQTVQIPHQATHEYLAQQMFSAIQSDLVENPDLTFEDRDLAAFYFTFAQVARNVGNDQAYVENLEKMIETLPRNDIYDELQVVDGLLWLTDAYLNYSISNIATPHQSTSVPGEHPSEPTAIQINEVRAKAIDATNDAIELVDYIVARSSHLPEAEKKRISAFQINSYSQFLYACISNQRADEGVLRVPSLLNYVSAFQREHGNETPFEVTTIVPAIKNAAETLIESSRGDAATAVTLSTQLLDRPAAETYAGSSAMSLSYLQRLAGRAYYKAGQLEFARTYLLASAERYTQETGRVYQTNFSFVVDGKQVFYNDLIDSLAR